MTGPPARGHWVVGSHKFGSGPPRPTNTLFLQIRDLSGVPRGCTGVGGSPAWGSLGATCGAEGLGDKPRPGGSAGRGPRSWPSPPRLGRTWRGDGLGGANTPTTTTKSFTDRCVSSAPTNGAWRLPLKARGVTRINKSDPEIKITRGRKQTPASAPCLVSWWGWVSLGAPGGEVGMDGRRNGPAWRPHQPGLGVKPSAVSLLLSGLLARRAGSVIPAALAAAGSSWVFVSGRGSSMSICLWAWRWGGQPLVGAGPPSPSLSLEVSRLSAQPWTPTKAGVGGLHRPSPSVARTAGSDRPDAPGECSVLLSLSSGGSGGPPCSCCTQAPVSVPSALVPDVRAADRRDERSLRVPPTLWAKQPPPWLPHPADLGELRPPPPTAEQPPAMATDARCPSQPGGCFLP